MKIKLINESRQFKLKSIIYELFPFKETWKNLFKSYSEQKPVIIQLKPKDKITKLTKEIDQKTGKWIIKGPDGMPLGTPDSATQGLSVDFKNEFDYKDQAENAIPEILKKLNNNSFNINNEELKNILLNKLRIEFVSLNLKEYSNKESLTEDDYFDKNNMFLKGVFRWSHMPDKEGKYTSSLSIDLGLPKIMISEFMNSEINSEKKPNFTQQVIQFYIDLIYKALEELNDDFYISRSEFYSKYYNYDPLLHVAVKLYNNQTIYDKLFYPILDQYIDKKTGIVTSEYDIILKEMERNINDINNIIYNWVSQLSHAPDDSNTIDSHIIGLINIIQNYNPNKSSDVTQKNSNKDKSRLINDSMKFIHDYMRSYIYHELTHAVQRHKTDPTGFATIRGPSKDFEEIRELIGEIESSKNATELERQNDLLHKYLLDPMEVEAWARTLFYNFQKSKGNINNAILTLDQFESWFNTLSKVSDKILTKKNWWSKTEIKKAPKTTKLAPSQHIRRGFDYRKLGHQPETEKRPVPKRTIQECLLAFDSATNTIKLFLKKIDRYIQVHYQQDLDLLSNFQPYLDYYNKNYALPIKEKYKDILNRPSIKPPLDLGKGYYGPYQNSETPGQAKWTNKFKKDINSDEEIMQLRAEREQKRREREEMDLALQRSRQQSAQQLQKRKEKRRFLELDSIQNKLKNLIKEALQKSVMKEFQEEIVPPDIDFFDDEEPQENKDWTVYMKLGGRTRPMIDYSTFEEAYNDCISNIVYRKISMGNNPGNNQTIPTTIAYQPQGENPKWIVGWYPNVPGYIKWHNEAYKR